MSPTAVVSPEDMVLSESRRCSSNDVSSKPFMPREILQYKPASQKSIGRKS